MKCRRHVSPLWKNPAANGPWYQVESNPVIPVPSRVLTPPAKCTTATAATSNAIVTSTGRSENALGLGDSSEPPRQNHTPPPTAATSTTYGTASNNPNVPRTSP